MIEKLKFILDEIQKVNAEPKVQPGASEITVLEAFEQIGITPPAYLVELYKWHNGIWNINAFLSMNSLGEATELHSLLCEMVERWEDFGWIPSWFPVLNLNGDVHYCIDVESGLLSAVDPEGGTVEILASNVGSFVNALVDVFASKSFSFKPYSGTVEIEGSAWGAIAAKHGINPAQRSN